MHLANNNKIAQVLPMYWTWRSCTCQSLSSAACFHVWFFGVD